VSDLLTKARYEGGQLYSLFKYISLTRLESDGEIEVRSPECEGLVFNTRDDFFRQLAYLDYIYNMKDVLQVSPEAPLARIDLSHGRSVPVTTSKKPGAALASNGNAPRGTAAATKPGQAPGKPQVASNGPAPRPALSAGQAGAQVNGRPLQAPTRPSNALPAFQNFQRNTTQREL
jgi:cell division protein FtsQ